MPERYYSICEHECAVSCLFSVGYNITEFFFYSVFSESESAAMINFSDDSEIEDDEFMPMPKSSKGTSPGPWTAAASATSMPPAGTAPRRRTVSGIHLYSHNWSISDALVL